MAEVAPSPARATVRVLRVRRYDRELRADVSSVYGYRGECPCGWRGDAQGFWGSARRELREHLEWGHDGNPTKGGND